MSLWSPRVTYLWELSYDLAKGQGGGFQKAVKKSLIF